MILIIMRHGEAEAYQNDDKSRVLTHFGTQQCSSAGKRLATYLKAHDMPLELDYALVSPYVRAQQSYAALGDSLQFNQQNTSDLVTPMGNATEVHDYIDGCIASNEARSNKQFASMIVVSHMPLVSLLSDKLCTGFDGKIYDTADMLLIDYNTDTHIGSFITMFQSQP